MAPEQPLYPQCTYLAQIKNLMFVRISGVNFISSVAENPLEWPFNNGDGDGQDINCDDWVKHAQSLCDE